MDAWAGFFLGGGLVLVGCGLVVALFDPRGEQVSRPIEKLLDGPGSAAQILNWIGWRRFLSAGVPLLAMGAVLLLIAK